MDTLMRWYNSPEYAPMKAIRHEASKGRLIAVQGL